MGDDRSGGAVPSPPPRDARIRPEATGSVPPAAGYHGERAQAQPSPAQVPGTGEEKRGLVKGKLWNVFGMRPLRMADVSSPVRKLRS